MLQLPKISGAGSRIRSSKSSRSKSKLSKSRKRGTSSMLMICLSILRDINLIIKDKIKELIKLDDEAEVVAVVKSARG